ncbi:hypothetical protein L917_15041 [Phytophthora nicotianae]|uniref:Uncharacterized protein n=1 Tax=Phytophthora nicotianae TaxID=4792 RepID=W2KM24_PHYNI|nr:hypothetical protein L915_15319 [Phytophthora nicotianae]ETL32160.1 hypothetical protein L916_15211 [Phytophthora nicotianae]ETL85400.1 hypothetical protein L917_15041 [Phytophthora nicotianae]
MLALPVNPTSIMSPSLGITSSVIPVEWEGFLMVTPTTPRRVGHH